MRPVGGYNAAAAASRGTRNDQYLEQPDWEEPGQVVRYVRKINYSSMWVDAGEGLPQLPLLVTREFASERKARHGITWRGLRRPRDREFAIAGGERLILDLTTNDVLAIRRKFVLSGMDHRKSRIWWANARVCKTWGHSSASNLFAPRVLLPLPNVNAGMRELAMSGYRKDSPDTKACTEFGHQKVQHEAK